MDLFTAAAQDAPLPMVPRPQPTTSDLPAYVEPTRHDTERQRLFSSDVGRYETAKKSNHGSAKIPQATVDSIEAGTITSAQIADLARSYPVYRYKTCLTIHGHWPTVDRERIGRYKNIHQNQNGSLEVLWTAIDLAAKRTIAAALEGCKSRMQYGENSTETYFRRSERIENAEQWNATLKEMRATEQRVNAVTGTNLRTTICKYPSIFGLMLELNVSALAIDQSAIEPLTLALSGYASRTDLDAAIAELKQKRAEQEAQWAKESKEREAARAIEIAPTVEKMNADLAIINAHVAQFPAALHIEPVPGRLYCRATYSKSEIRAYLKSMTVSKGSFGRLKAEIRKHYVMDGKIDAVGEVQTGRYGQAMKQQTPKELKDSQKFPDTWKFVK